MSDLAQALVDLGKAATERRLARRQLEQATATVAAAIRKQLRAGDCISIEKRTVPADLVVADSELDHINASFSEDGQTATLGGAVYGVGRVFDAKGKLQQVLYREAIGPDWAILDEIEVHGDDPRALTDPEKLQEYHRASAAERLLFAREAPDVIAEFARYAAGEASSFARAAGAVTKLAVR